ncbi:MAG: NAD(P)/FAD-dependent oxidoreductase [Planctomycetota bacterium]
MHHEVIIVGGGLAGLACARELHEAGRPSLVLEAGDRVGGRVQTDAVETADGTYLVDRGFQVLLTAYPETTRVLDYDALDLRAFYPGALVQLEGSRHLVADPRRKPLDATRLFTSPIATTGDKLRLAEMSLRVLSGSLDGLWEKPEKPSIDALRDAGFAESTIDRFFRPFFGGVFFDRELATSSRMLEFCFRMFATGRTCVPSRGMRAIPEQLAGMLPASAVQTSNPVRSMERDGERWRVRHEGGESTADALVLATDGDAARGLVPDLGLGPTAWRRTVTLAFACDAPPVDRPILVLDGDGEGPINHLAVMTNVADTYAPTGKHLVYANTADEASASLDGDTLHRRAIAQLRNWFGEAVDGWTLLRIARVDRALPDQRPPWLGQPRREIVRPDKLAVCGDWLANASINGAMESGARAARAVLDVGS